MKRISVFSSLIFFSCLLAEDAVVDDGEASLFGGLRRLADEGPRRHQRRRRVHAQEHEGVEHHVHLAQHEGRG